MYFTSLVRYVRVNNMPRYSYQLCELCNVPINYSEGGGKLRTIVEHKRVISCKKDTSCAVHEKCLKARGIAECIICKAPIIPSFRWWMKKVLMIGTGVGAFLGALPYITDITIAALSKIAPYPFKFENF